MFYSTMKKIILLIFLVISNTISAQNEMTTSNGIINFEASVPLFEEIKAINDIATCVLNTSTGEIYSMVLIKDFQFKLPLMQKHFNENYIESTNYPKAVFKGVIEGFNKNIISSSPKEFKLKGTLKLHGKQKKINTTAIFRNTNNGLEIIANFSVKTEDFNIKIPQMLSMKVAENVNVKTFFIVK